MTTTSPSNNPFFGPPLPVLDLKVEQQFKLRQIEDALRNPDTKKEDIITIFMALQRQCFVLGNNMTNLLMKWPLPTPQVQPTTDVDPSKFGTSYGIKG